MPVHHSSWYLTHLSPGDFAVHLHIPLLPDPPPFICTPIPSHEQLDAELSMYPVVTSYPGVSELGIIVIQTGSRPIPSSPLSFLCHNRVSFPSCTITIVRCSFICAITVSNTYTHRHAHIYTHHIHNSTQTSSCDLFSLIAYKCTRSFEELYFQTPYSFFYLRLHSYFNLS